MSDKAPIPECEAKKGNLEGKLQSEGRVVDDVVVRRHIQWFATAEGYITAESMQTGHDKLGVTSGVSVKITAILNLLAQRFPQKGGRSGQPFTIDDLLTIVNEARLGIWTDKGKFDDARFHQITKLFHPVISSADKKESTGATRKAFDTELNAISERIPEAKRTGTTVYGFIGVTWKAVTSGSIDELVQYWSDSYVPGPKPGAMPVAAISKDQMRKFYSDGGWTLFEERAAKVAVAKANDPKAPLQISTAEQINAKSSSCSIM